MTNETMEIEKETIPVSAIGIVDVDGIDLTLAMKSDGPLRLHQRFVDFLEAQGRHRGSVGGRILSLAKGEPGSLFVQVMSASERRNYFGSRFKSSSIDPCFVIGAVYHVDTPKITNQPRTFMSAMVCYNAPSIIEMMDDDPFTLKLNEVLTSAVATPGPSPLHDLAAAVSIRRVIRLPVVGTGYAVITSPTPSGLTSTAKINVPLSTASPGSSAPLAAEVITHSDAIQTTSEWSTLPKRPEFVVPEPIPKQPSSEELELAAWQEKMKTKGM